jgi:hypothetical protein
MFRKLRRAAVLAAVGALAGAAPAAAASTPAGTHHAPAVSAHPALYLPAIFVVHGQPVTVPGRVVHVVGIVRPYVAGQWVNVRAYLGSHLLRHERLRIKPSPGERSGRFSLALSSRSPGTVSIAAGHSRTPQMRGFLAHRSFTVLTPSAGPGATGRFVQLIQQRLAALHFYIPQSGVYDNGTELAVDAYHRLLGWGTSSALDGRTVSFLLNGWGEFKVRYPHQGRHAEGNLSRQLLALIDGRNVQLIFPISSGKPSTPTILGSFHVYQRTPGYLPDGMYYSDFFSGGYAIHGYDPAPDYPASHGCMRLPISDAIAAYNWLAIGDGVDVYY